MDLFKESAGKVNIQVLCQRTDIKAERLRIELAGINKNRKFAKLGFSIKSDRQNRGLYSIYQSKSDID